MYGEKPEFDEAFATVAGLAEGIPRLGKRRPGIVRDVAAAINSPRHCTAKVLT